MDDASGYYGSICAADIDGDTDLDVVGVLTTGIFPFEGHFTWWENHGGSGTSWIEHYMAYLWSPTVCYPVDLDGDDDIDVLVDAESGGFEWWENEDGLGTSWSSHWIDGTDRVRSLYATDMDGDQDVDVLYASFDNTIGWFENIDGSGTSWVEHQVISAFYGASSVCAADIDDDTDMDIVGAAEADAEITWWEVTEFKPAGELVSSILDLECDPEWHMINWTWHAPEGTSIKFQVRASDDYTNMGEWSGMILSPGSLHGVLSDGDSYLQYKTMLMSTYPDPGYSPLLEDVTISWTPLGIASGESAVSRFVLQPTTPNPIFGSATISFVIPKNCHVRLRVFDVSGRLVARLVENNLQIGKHTVVFDAQDLTSGIYYYRLEAGTFTQTRRCVLLK